MSPASGIYTWLPASFLTYDSRRRASREKLEVAEVCVCQARGCPRRVVTYKDEKLDTLSKARRLRGHTSKECAKPMHTHQYSALHIQGWMNSREIHASRRNHIATAKVEIIVF